MPPPAAVLDCAKGFEALSAAVAATPGMTRAPKTPGEPYSFYNAEDGKTSYVVTEAGAPGHPAILMQAMGPAGQETTGCPFGDKAGYDQLAAYLASLAQRPAQGPGS
jgi:hypothetical protein